jgi:DNA-binding CsgD family transcriptional regulator
VPGETVVGRAAELAALSEFLPAPGALMLTGGPGIGKTTLWEAGIAAARDRGMRVLSARPTGAEAELAFAALIDVCDGIETEGLAVPQRWALDVALLRVRPGGPPPEPHAIALGFLNLVRRLADREPVLIAVDDVQWLDGPSADVLAFAARRLAGAPVGFLLAKRPGSSSVLEQAFERGALQRLQVGPLSFGATRRLLADRLGLTLTRHLLRRITDSTLGNPLFALELGRTVLERGLPELGEDLPVPDAVEDMLGTRVAGLPDETRRLLLAAALSGELHSDELGAIADRAAVEDAVDAGLLVADGERVRAAHPLLAAAAKQRSRPRERRELHLALAGAVADVELRALHLALATRDAEPVLAADVAVAAAAASARGARAEAVQLAEHAVRLTPRGSNMRGERLLALGGYLETAGQVDRITELLEPELESFAPGPMRARAWLLLAEGAHVRTLEDLLRHFDLALAECEDDRGLRAEALAKKAIHSCASSMSAIPQAEAWALEALTDAQFEGPGAVRLALDALCWARVMRGRPIDDLLARFHVVSDAVPFMAESPERPGGLRLIWRGDMREARPQVTRLLAIADARGEPVSHALERAHLCELELRAGEWDAAEQLLDEWAQSAERELLIPPLYEKSRAALAAGRGLPGETESWTAKTLAVGEATGSVWEPLEARLARGTVAALAHEPARALEDLRAIWEHTQREGIDDPGVLPVAPELVEALVAVGEPGEARAVSERLRELSEQQEHPWGLATARRCGAVVRLASDGYDEAHAAAMVDAAAAYEELGLRFDRARTLLSLGRGMRRLKQWRDARESLEQAVAAFDALGSPGWAEEARAQLARVGGRKPGQAGGLTPSEQRVAELAADGRSNKEIARTLFVTVHTVEVHLSRAYAKLGVRSRSQLAGRLVGQADD